MAKQYKAGQGTGQDKGKGLDRTRARQGRQGSKAYCYVSGSFGETLFPKQTQHVKYSEGLRALQRHSQDFVSS